MRNKYNKFSQEEKARLITLFIESGDSASHFIEKHGIPKATFYRWMKVYRNNGIEGLQSNNSNLFKNIAPELSSETELRREILKLRIENERLKKNYTVQTDQNGKTEYIRLKPKNTK